MGALFALLLAAMALAPLAQGPVPDVAAADAQLGGPSEGATAAATTTTATATADSKAQAKARAKGQADGGAEADTAATAGQWATAEAPADAAAADTPQFEAEEQVATGKFLTALEVKPILSATKSGWIAIREYNGQDLVYFTQVLAWRCGLHQIRFAVNGGPEKVLTMEPCYPDTATPSALKAEDVLPYLNYPLGSVESVSLRLIYDDNTEDTASYQRASVLMP